jgi:rubrerythrin
MKKDDLIKLAADRGINLSEKQAEKYTELSDEELENLAGGGEIKCRINDGSVLGTLYDCRSCGNRVTVKDSDVPKGLPPTCPICGSANLKYQAQVSILPNGDYY